MNTLLLNTMYHKNLCSPLIAGLHWKGGRASVARTRPFVYPYYSGVASKFDVVRLIVMSKCMSTMLQMKNLGAWAKPIDLHSIARFKRSQKV